MKRDVLKSCPQRHNGSAKLQIERVFHPQLFDVYDLHCYESVVQAVRPRRPPLLLSGRGVGSVERGGAGWRLTSNLLPLIVIRLR